MAFTLSTIYKAVDRFSPVIKQMERANSNFAAKQDKALRQMGSAISNVKNQLIGLAGGFSVASLFAIGTNAVVKYDEALKSLSAITGLAGKEFEPFKRAVMEVAQKTSESAIDVAKAFELVGSAQPELLKDAAALSKVTEASIILSKASRDDLAVSAANLTGVLNQFGLGSEHALRAINVLSAGAVVGAASISDVNAAMKNVGAVASSSNASLEETVALIEVLGKFQLKGAEAGTKLKGVFLQLQKAGMGYASGQFNINDAFLEANAKLNKLTSAKQKDAFMTKLFGSENIIAGKIILSNLALFEEYTKGVTGTNSAMEMADKNTSSFVKKLKALKSTYENLIIKGSESSKALNKFGKVLEFLTKHLGKVLALTGLTITAFAAYYTVMTAIRIATISYNVALGVLFAFQKSVPISLAASSAAMKAYAFATKIATGIQWLFNTALLSNPLSWFIIGIVATIAAVTILVWKWKEITAWFEKSSTAMKLLLTPLIIANSSLIAIAFVIRKVIDHWKGLTKAFADGGFLEGIKAVGKVIFSVLLKPLELVLALLGKIPGMGFAKKGAEMLAQYRENLEAGTLQTEESKPVNIQKANNDAQINRYEEFTMNKLQIELANKTDKKANIKSNPALIPVTTTTF